MYALILMTSKQRYNTYHLYGSSLPSPSIEIVCDVAPNFPKSCLFVRNLLQFIHLPNWNSPLDRMCGMIKLQASRQTLNTSPTTLITNKRNRMADIPIPDHLISCHFHTLTLRLISGWKTYWSTLHMLALLL